MANVTHIEALLKDLQALAPLVAAAVANGKNFWKDVPLLEPIVAQLEDMSTDGPLIKADLASLSGDTAAILDLTKEVLDGILAIARSIALPTASASEPAIVVSPV